MLLYRVWVQFDCKWLGTLSILYIGHYPLRALGMKKNVKRKDEEETLICCCNILYQYFIMKKDNQTFQARGFSGKKRNVCLSSVELQE